MRIGEAHVLGAVIEPRAPDVLETPGARPYAGYAADRRKSALAVGDVVAEHQGVVLAEQMIESPVVLVDVIHGARIGDQISRGVGGVVDGIHERHDVRGNRMDAVSRDRVVGERHPLAGFRIEGKRVVDDAELAGVENSVALLVVRHDVDGRSSLPRSQTFEREEAEGLVLDDRPAHGSSELVLPIRRAVRQDREEVPAVELGVPEELIDGAVKLVRARLDHQVHHDAALGRKLGRVVAGLDLELLNGFDVRPHGEVVVLRVHVGDAVQGNLLVLLAGAHGRHRRELPLIPFEKGPRHGWNDAGLQQGQLQKLALVERELDNLRVFDHAPDVRRVGGEHRSRTFDRHDFRDLARPQFKIDARRLVKLKDDVAHFLLAESLQYGGDVVAA